jgi:hypothetical protein
MAAYVDHEFYEDEYGGTAIALADFGLYAIRASAEIDYLTYDRAAEEIDEDTTLVTAIKNAVCAVADEMYTIAQAGHSKQIQSEKVGSYSVTYAETPETNLSEHERMSRAAKRYLGRTGLMFPGFYSGEYGGTSDLDD